MSEYQQVQGLIGAGQARFDAFIANHGHDSTSAEACRVMFLSVIEDSINAPLRPWSLTWQLPSEESRAGSGPAFVADFDELIIETADFDAAE